MKKYGPKGNVKILAEAFEDYYKGLKSEAHPSLSIVQNPYVSTGPLNIKSVSDIRGVYDAFVRIHFTMKLASRRLDLVDNQYVKAQFFPVWHPLGLGRKSRFASIITFGGGQEFNGRENIDINYGIVSKNPRKYSVWRAYMIRAYKTALVDSIRRNETDLNGTLFIIVKKFQTDPNDRQNAADELIKKSILVSQKTMGDYRWKDNLFSKLRKRRLTVINELKQDCLPVNNSLFIK